MWCECSTVREMWMPCLPTSRRPSSHCFKANATESVHAKPARCCAYGVSTVPTLNLGCRPRAVVGKGRLYGLPLEHTARHPLCAEIDSISVRTVARVDAHDCWYRRRTDSQCQLSADPTNRTTVEYLRGAFADAGGSAGRRHQLLTATVARRTILLAVVEMTEPPAEAIHVLDRTGARDRRGRGRRRLGRRSGQSGAAT